MCYELNKQNRKPPNKTANEGDKQWLDVYVTFDRFKLYLAYNITK